MSKHSSDSNTRDRTRSYGRYYNQRHRTSSSSSIENSRHSRKYYSSKSGSRYHKKSKHRHRSNSSSEYSSKYKHSNRTYYKDESRSKKSYRRKSSSSSRESDHSNSSLKNNQSKRSKISNDNEKTKVSQLNSTSDVQTADAVEFKCDTTVNNDQDVFQKNDYDVIKMENSIEEINQEGFVFKVFKQQKDNEIEDCYNFDVPKLSEEIINSLPIEKSTFVISNRDRLLNARYKLLTKQERCIQWAKHLFSTYNQSENDTVDENIEHE